MRACLDDLVIAPYCVIDDRIGPRRGPGRPPRLSDAELVCLAVAQVLLGARSEHHWLRFARRRLGHLFPYLPKQPGLPQAAARLGAPAHRLALAGDAGEPAAAQDTHGTVHVHLHRPPTLHRDTAGDRARR